MDPYVKLQRAAVVDCTVLLLGAGGIGQEFVAKYLHDNSPRRNGPFIVFNGAAMPSTLVERELLARFELADGGTLFIDEIADLGAGVQETLVRVLETCVLPTAGGDEEKKVNVRVVSATSQDIEKMVREGEFREDLFYRLNVVTIELPPLPGRGDD